MTTREAAPPTLSPAKNTEKRPRPLSSASPEATSIPACITPCFEELLEKGIMAK